MAIIPPNPILASLKRGETVVGLWSSTGSPDLAEAAARLGWPMIVIDNEHGVADLNQAVAIHRAALAGGAEALIRVPSNDPIYLKRTLDRGFRCIMAPMVNSAAEAEAFVRACRYPPKGARGYAAPIVRASGWGTTPDYVSRANDELLLVAQIEHIDAVERIDEIAAVDGIDALLLGPNDLAGSLGMLERLHEPALLEVFEQVERETRANGKVFGSILRPGRDVAALREAGCQLICGPSDIGLFLDGARAARAEFGLPTE